MIISYIGSAQTDVHCHMIPESYLSAVKAHGMEMDEGFPIPGWSADAHLAFMDEAGIGTAVLTMPAPQPYFGDGAQSAAERPVSVSDAYTRTFVEPVCVR
jgi:hypothetical protein